MVRSPFAAITDDPTPEVAATGHQRTIITIQEQYLSEWLSPTAVSRDRLERIVVKDVERAAFLSDNEMPYYVHQIAP
jgi:putative SOS response-associated peptidase YedK